MVDFARITVTAGSGGHGGSSRTQIKGKRYSKADGGNGGNGGNVYIVATRDLNTLEPYRFVKNYKAEDGKIGLGNQRRGANGQDLDLKVPVGTLVRIGDPETSDSPTHRLADSPTRRLTEYDLTEADQKVLITRGGEGGRGNAHLRDELGRRPYQGEVGSQGETVNLTLELKLIADIGLIGLPNAGKSTLLSTLTSAHPQIAAYPFTTLEPNLGVLTTDYRLQTTVDSKLKTVDSLVLADIPGLIEGASIGKGLGHQFLRHIERTKLLVHLIDSSTQDPWKDYQTVREELKKFNKELAKKKEIIVLTKIDKLSALSLSSVLSVIKSHRKKVIPISAVNGQGLDNLLKEISKH